MFMRDVNEIEKEKELERILQVVTEDPIRAEKLRVSMKFLKALFISAADIKAREKIHYMKEMPKFSPVKPNLSEAPEPEYTKEIVYPIQYTLLFASNLDLVMAKVENNGKIIYNLLEPKIDYDILKECKEEIKLRMKLDKKILKDDKYLMGKWGRVYKKKNLEFNLSELEKIRYMINRDAYAFGLIDGFFRDGNILGVICDGINKPVLVDYKILGKIETSVVYSNEKDIAEFIRKFVVKSGEAFDAKKTEYNVKYGNFRLLGSFGKEEVSSKFILRREQ
ncbi:MAG: hypothetical protein PHE43_03765 [Candidatus Nanoarchaeia archaeon]|nr:hypothetical protein [Candidatus Nanoarchaeia archaeon]